MMTKDEIAETAERIRRESNETGTPMSMASGLSMLKFYKRVVNDLCVLIRELAKQ